MARRALLVLLAALLSAHAAAPPTDPGWKRLFDGKTLTNWKSVKFGDEGKVYVKDGMIVLEKGQKLTGIVYTRGDFPKVNYEVTYEGKKIDGDDFFSMPTLPARDEFFSFVTGGWRGTVVGISNVNGANASENITTKSMEFERDRWYRFRVRVTANRIEAWIDREKVVDLDTSDVTLSLHLASRPSRPFGFSSYDTTGAVRDIRLRQLSPAEVARIEAAKD
ncbi:MAG: DUF1080 domain-containing protein [Gemmataceae bacterium]